MATSSSSVFPLQELPDLVIFKVLNYLTYHQVAQMRTVSQFFKRVGQDHLKHGLQQARVLQSQYMEEFISAMPKRQETSDCPQNSSL